MMQYVLLKGVPVPVRVSSNGNLCGADAAHMSVCIAKKGEKYSEIFPDVATAEAMQRKIEIKCDHKWALLSHEEFKCRKCGAVKFVEDQ